MCSGLTAAVISVIGARTRRLVAQLYTPQHLSRPEQQTLHTAQEAEKLYIACSSWIFVSSLLSYHCPYPSLYVFSAVFLLFKHIIIRSIFHIRDNVAFLRFSH